MKRLKPLVPPVLVGMIVPSVLKLAVHTVGIEMGLIPATAITLLAYGIYLWNGLRKQDKADRELEQRLIELRIETDNNLNALDKSIYKQAKYQEATKLTMDEVESLWITYEIEDIKRFKNELDNEVNKDTEEFFQDK